MRTNVTFKYPAELAPISAEEGVLSVRGSKWFVALLQRVPGLQIKERLCQEDWGVVVFARRNQRRFWIGLSPWYDEEHAWLAHFHHAPFAWSQRFTASGKAELERIVADFRDVLTSDPAVSMLGWYHESEMSDADPHSCATPHDG